MPKEFRRGEVGGDNGGEDNVEIPDGQVEVRRLGGRGRLDHVGTQVQCRVDQTWVDLGQSRTTGPGEVAQGKHGMGNGHSVFLAFREDAFGLVGGIGESGYDGLARVFDLAGREALSAEESIVVTFVIDSSDRSRESTTVTHKRHPVFERRRDICRSSIHELGDHVEQIV